MEPPQPPHRRQQDCSGHSGWTLGTFLLQKSSNALAKAAQGVGHHPWRRSRTGDVALRDVDSKHSGVGGPSLTEWNETISNAPEWVISVQIVVLLFIRPTHGSANKKTQV